MGKSLPGRLFPNGSAYYLRLWVELRRTLELKSDAAILIWSRTLTQQLRVHKR